MNIEGCKERVWDDGDPLRKIDCGNPVLADNLCVQHQPLRLLKKLSQPDTTFAQLDTNQLREEIVKAANRLGHLRQEFARRQQEAQWSAIADMNKIVDRLLKEQQ